MKRITWLAIVAVAIACTVGVWNNVHARQDGVVFDEHVTVVSFEDLYYPPMHRAARIEGVVVIAVKLDSRGDVVSASAVSGPEKLIPIAVENAKKWKFEPNRQKKAVIVYDFDIDAGTCHDKTRSLFLLKHRNFASIKSCENLVGG